LHAPADTPSVYHWIQNYGKEQQYAVSGTSKNEKFGLSVHLVYYWFFLTSFEQE